MTAQEMSFLSVVRIGSMEVDRRNPAVLIIGIIGTLVVRGTGAKGSVFDERLRPLQFAKV
jgi:hypothetical protein